MLKKIFLLAALVVVVGAAFLLLLGHESNKHSSEAKGFVKTRRSSFVIDGQPFRFVGANVAIMYRDDDRERMAETLSKAAQMGIRVVRVWASAEGGPNDVRPVADFADWPRTHPFRWAPNQWNEETFVHLDKVLARAAQLNLKVQLCLGNWWRDTGGVTQYLRWAGIWNAADDHYRFGINTEVAMLFYSNGETRRLYREHLEKLALRRNTVTGNLYRDDPTIMGWELLNEAQAVTGRWSERRAWITEMSSYLKSLDPNHLITPGDWGYRTAAERREWLADHLLATVDYCDVHNYPRDDLDSFVDSPRALREFIDNRAAAALFVQKPLVFGEFGMGVDGYNGFSQIEWYRSFLQGNIEAGSAGTSFWILTPDPNRGYGVNYTTSRDSALLSEISRAAQITSKLESADPPSRLADAGHHLVPRQFTWSRPAGVTGTVPQMILGEDKSILYRFKPEMAVQERFEKIGSGPGYLWGFGVGLVEYEVPARADLRQVDQIVIRAHIQPVLPVDARPQDIKTRVRLYLNGEDCGSRLVAVEDPKQPSIQEWRIDGLVVRLRAMRGFPIRFRFVVSPESDWLYGVNISNWPEGYDSHNKKSVEVKLRR